MLPAHSSDLYEHQVLQLNRLRIPTKVSIRYVTSVRNFATSICKLFYELSEIFFL